MIGWSDSVRIEWI